MFTKFTTYTRSFFLCVKKWGPTITLFIAIGTLIATYFSNKQTLDLASRAIVGFEEQITMEKKSIPAQFSIEYLDEGTPAERAVIKNTGKTILRNLKAEYFYYFVTPTYTVYSRLSLERMLKNDKDLFKKFKQSGLLNYPENLKSLLGLNNSVFYEEVLPNETFICEINTFANANALKISSVLNTETVIRWKITYNDELANKKNSNTFFVWLHHPFSDEKSQPGRESSVIESLETVLGGQKLIDCIENFERGTTEVIFEK